MGLSLPAFTPHTPPHPQVLAHLQEDLRTGIGPYSISGQPFSPYLTNPPGRAGEGSEGVLLAILY